MINLSKPALPLLVLSALAVVGIIVLTVLKQPIPEVLSVIAYAGLTAASAATVPNHTHDATVVAGDGTLTTVAAAPVALVPAPAAVPAFPVPPAS